MSIITYFRSSILGAIDFCEHKTFAEYTLGIGNHDFFDTSESVKTTVGTMSHKVLECLGAIKLASDNDLSSIEDDALGTIPFSSAELMTPYTLTDKEVDFVNRTRKNKDTYRNQNSCKIDYGHTRYGVKLVEDLIQRSYGYYSVKIEQAWQPKHFKDLTNFVWMVLDYEIGKKRLYDPRNQKVIAVEPHFDFELEDEWASYEYKYKGRDLKGQLSLKGTIDLVTEIDASTVQVSDYKTGQRIHWATGDVKTYDKLEMDTQLLLYNLAVRKLFPQYENVICTIFFIRDGGPFSIPMDNTTCIDEIKNRIREKFEYIRDMDKPKLRDESQQDFRCKYMCDLYKNSFPKFPKMNCCTYLKKYIEKYGTEKAIENLSGPGHDVDNYKAPGEA